MSDEPPAREPVAEDARIAALEERLKAARERDEIRNRPKNDGASADYRIGNRVLADLLGGLLGGFVIGWVIDAFAGTSPWGLLVMLTFGIIVAFRNIIRAAQTRPDGPADEQNKGS
ncbi:MAG: AtpZ/AtpI family protein [Erythrobacter sp.]